MEEFSELKSARLLSIYARLPEWAAAEKGASGAGIRRYGAQHPARSGIAALIPLQ